MGPQWERVHLVLLRLDVPGLAGGEGEGVMGEGLARVALGGEKGDEAEMGT